MPRMQERDQKDLEAMGKYFHGRMRAVTPGSIAAKDLADQMKNAEYPFHRTMARLASKCFAYGQDATSLGHKVVETMIQRLPEANEPEKQINRIINLLLDYGYSEQAFDFVERKLPTVIDLDSISMRLVTYSFCRAYIMEGQAEKAEKLFPMLADQDQNYIGALSHFFNGNASAALHLMDPKTLGPHIPRIALFMACLSPNAPLAQMLLSREPKGARPRILEARDVLINHKNRRFPEPGALSSGANIFALGAAPVNRDTANAAGLPKYKNG